MILPLFDPGNDPGPNFAALLRRVSHLHSLESAGLSQYDSVSGSQPAAVSRASMDLVGEVRHGTTCVAVRYRDGVILAGDRRATSGNFISHHRIEKVFPADSHSGVAIAGAAGPAAEMVRLFQLQLEHYEKVEGTPISLEGKANQLSQMVRSNLPAAMRGLVVVPIFAGFDRLKGSGRIFEYDITGGRYEERDHAATGSGSMHATTVLQLGFRSSLSRDKATDLVLEALFVAADSDSATGGPDLTRNIFPVVAAISVEGYEPVTEDELRDRTDQLVTRFSSRQTDEDDDAS